MELEKFCEDVLDVKLTIFQKVVLRKLIKDFKNKKITIRKENINKEIIDKFLRIVLRKGN